MPVRSSSCTEHVTEVTVDGGLAGKPALLAAMVPAVIVLAIATFTIVVERVVPVERRRDFKFLMKLVGNYSSGQLVNGVVQQVITLATMDLVEPYHFSLFWLVTQLCSTVHNASLLAFPADFQRESGVRRGFRLGLALFHFLATTVSGSLVLTSQLAGRAGSRHSVYCVWSSSFAFQGNAGECVFSAVILLTNAAVTLLALALLVLPKKTKGPQWWLRIGGLFFGIVLGVLVTVRLVQTSAAFGTPPLALDSRYKSNWGFGQMNAIAMAIIPWVQTFFEETPGKRGGDEVVVVGEARIKERGRPSVWEHNGADGDDGIDGNDGNDDTQAGGDVEASNSDTDVQPKRRVGYPSDN